MNQALKQMEVASLKSDYRIQTIQFMETRCQQLLDNYENILIQNLKLVHKDAINSTLIQSLKTTEKYNVNGLIVSRSKDKAIKKVSGSIKKVKKLN